MFFLHSQYHGWWWPTDAQSQANRSRSFGLYFPGVFLLQQKELRILCQGPFTLAVFIDNPDSKVHGANMGPICGRQDPGGPHVGPLNFVIWEAKSNWEIFCWCPFIIIIIIIFCVIVCHPVSTNLRMKSGDIVAFWFQKDYGEV